MTDSLRAAAQAVVEPMVSLIGYRRSDYNDYDPAPDLDRVEALLAALAQAEERDAAVEELVEAVRQARSLLFTIDDIDTSLEGADSPYMEAVNNILWGEVLDSMGRPSMPNVNSLLFGALATYNAAVRRLSSTPEEEQG